MTAKTPRLVIGIDKAKDGDYGCEARGYWLNGTLHIVSLKTKKAPSSS